MRQTIQTKDPEKSLFFPKANALKKEFQDLSFRTFTNLNVQANERSSLKEAISDMEVLHNNSSNASPLAGHMNANSGEQINIVLKHSFYTEILVKL